MRNLEETCEGQQQQRTQASRRKVRHRCYKESVLLFVPTDMITPERALVVVGKDALGGNVVVDGRHSC